MRINAGKDLRNQVSEKNRGRGILRGLPFELLLGLAGTLLVALAAIPAIDAFVAAPGFDSAIYLYVGQGILDGFIPYVDRWDNKGPLFYLINALAVLLDLTWGTLVVQVLFLMAASVFAFLALRSGFGALPALFALAFFLTLFGKFAPPGNFTEQYGLFFQFGALYLFTRSLESGSPKPQQPSFALLHLGIGLLGAASFLIRPNLVVLWPAIGLVWLVSRTHARQKLTWAVVGGAGPLLLVAALFSTLGALEASFSAYFGYNFAMSTNTMQDRLGVAQALTSAALPISLLVIAAWFASVFLLARNRVGARPGAELLAVGIVALPFEIASLSLSGFGYSHYFLAALPAATVPLAFAARAVLDHTARARLPVAALMLVGAACYVLPSLSFAHLVEKYTRPPVVEEPLEAGAARRVVSWTESGDPILVWGNNASIHLRSGRNAPTRYFYHHPLVKPNYTTPAMRDEFFADVFSAKPRLIVDSHYFELPPLDREERMGWQPHRRYWHDPQDFQPLYDFVEEHYVPIGEIPPFTFYHRRSDFVLDPAAIQGKRIIRSSYTVYLHGRTLTYAKTDCTHRDAGNRFILQVVPVDNSAIGGNSHATLDFHFFEGTNWQTGRDCIVSRELPDFPIAVIRTGQYNAAGTGDVWLAEYALQAPQ